jgi:hypothetical protein
LLDAYADHRDRCPEDAGKQPLVALQSDRYDHRQYGEVDTPRLTIVGWADPPADIKIRAPASATMTIGHAAPTPQIEHKRPAADPEPAAALIDDDIPF